MQGAGTDEAARSRQTSRQVFERLVRRTLSLEEAAQVLSQFDTTGVSGLGRHQLITFLIHVAKLNSQHSTRSSAPTMPQQFLKAYIQQELPALIVDSTPSALTKLLSRLQLLAKPPLMLALSTAARAVLHQHISSEVFISQLFAAPGKGDEGALGSPGLRMAAVLEAWASANREGLNCGQVPLAVMTQLEQRASQLTSAELSGIKECIGIINAMQDDGKQPLKVNLQPAADLPSRTGQLVGKKTEKEQKEEQRKSVQTPTTASAPASKPLSAAGARLCVQALLNEKRPDAVQLSAACLALVDAVAQAPMDMAKEDLEWLLSATR